MHPALVAMSAGIAGAFALAMVAVIVSRNAQTGQVFQAAGGALGSVISAAVSPVTSGAGGLTGTNMLGNSAGNALSLGSLGVNFGTY